VRGRRCADTKANTSPGTVARLLADNVEEDLQVVRVGPHRVRAGPPRHELQEVIDHGMADSVVDLATVVIGDALKRRTPLHGILLGLGKPREVPWALNPGGGSPV